MRKKVLWLWILAAGCVLAAAEPNLWQDSSFEASGNCDDAHSGAKSLQITLTKPIAYQTNRSAELPVEPFAVYRASAYVKGSAAGGGVRVLDSYGWNSFGWYFTSSNNVTGYKDWTPVSNTFSVPDSTVTFAPVVFQNAKAADIKIDDLEIVRIRTGAEHIAELKAKTKLNTEERLLLARHYVSQGDLKSADAIREADDYLAKTEIACLIAGKLSSFQERRPYLVDMIAYDGLHFYGCDGSLRKFFRKMTPEEQCSVICDAVRKNPKSAYTAKAFALPRSANEASGYPGQKKYIDALLTALSKIPADIRAIPEVRKILDAETAQCTALQKKLQEKISTLGSRTITVEGRNILPETHVIVIPDHPTNSEQHAAEELKSHWELLTGNTLAILPESRLDERLPFIIGKAHKALKKYQIFPDFAKLGTDGIYLKTQNGALALAGNQRGVLYAVYSFLEDHIGVRWFTADCMTLPKENIINIPSLNRTYIPPLEYRDTDYRHVPDFRFSIRNKLNGLHIDSVPKWGGTIHYKGFVHTFDQLVPPKVYGASHPEYFSEINGKRVIEKTQLCLTNPDVLKIATATVRRWIKEAAPQKVIISVSQNDWHNFCTCKKCAALAAREGSQSGPLLHFVNAIAEDVSKDYPDQIIDTLAYQYSRKPPKHVRPHRNVAIRLCSVECCFSHPLSQCSFNREFVNDVKGWAAICKRLYIWGYVTNFYHSIMPFPNLQVIQPNILFFVRNGAKGIYEEGNYYSLGGEFAELRAYLIAKALWNPRTNSARDMQDFLEGFYGPAAPFIAAYIRNLHGLVCGNRGIHVTIFSEPYDYLKNPRFLEKATGLFLQAREAVKDNETYLHRVNMAMLPIIYTRFSLGGKLYKRYGDVLNLDSGDAGVDLGAIFRETVQKANITKYKEGKESPLQWLERVRPSSAKIGIVTLENNFLRLEILPRVGGRIWRVVYKPKKREIFHVSGSNKKGYEPKDSGMEVCGSKEDRGDGAFDEFTVTGKSDTSVTLTCKLKSGNTLTRTVELVPGKAAFKVNHSLTQTAQSGELLLRVRPVFRVTSPANIRLGFTGRNGKKQSFQPGRQTKPAAKNEVWFRDGECPAGSWSFTDSKSGLAVTNTFPADQVKDCYCSWDAKEPKFTMEQWSAPQNPPAGKPLVLENTYEIRSR